MKILKLKKLILLVYLIVPVAILMEIFHASDIHIFIVSGLAIIPLAGLLGKSTEQLAIRTSPAIGGLLNASLGNLAELIICLFALSKGYIEIVKASPETIKMWISEA